MIEATAYLHQAPVWIRMNSDGTTTLIVEEILRPPWWAFWRPVTIRTYQFEAFFSGYEIKEGV